MLILLQQLLHLSGEVQAPTQTQGVTHFHNYLWMQKFLHARTERLNFGAEISTCKNCRNARVPTLIKMMTMENTLIGFDAFKYTVYII